jgi:hypothetical protein
MDGQADEWMPYFLEDGQTEDKRRMEDGGQKAMVF